MNSTLYYYKTSGRLVFVRFFGGNLRHFKVNWPLSSTAFKHICDSFWLGKHLKSKLPVQDIRSYALSFCIWFLKTQVWKLKFNKLDFWPAKINFEIDFAGYTVKIHIEIVKIHSFKIDFSNLIFQKSSKDG